MPAKPSTTAQKKKPRAGPLTLGSLTFEQALDLALRTPLPDAERRRHRPKPRKLKPSA